MINKIIFFSIKNKLIIGLMMLAWIGFGIYSMKTVPVDAVPDITNNQVQVITVSPNLGTEDIEQFVTSPVELAMANLPNVVEIRSISRFGLSVVTIVFEDDMGTYLPRQLVSEKLEAVKSDIPPNFGSPFMGPISTGLGEIYQYTLEVDSSHQGQYSPTDLRTFQDWIVKRQMAMLPGVIEVNSFGGYIKQYEIAVSPDHLKSMGITITDIFNAVESNNENTGGAYIVKNHKANFIKGEGLLTSLDDIENTVVKNENGIPILIKDVATVQFGTAIRYGSVTKDGQGQAVGGMIMMLKGENSKDVINRVKKRITEIEKSLPDGITIEPFLDRSDLIGRTTSTVQTNLVEGGLIVIFILVIFLGNFRGGLIVASTIPLSLLFAYIMMNWFGVWSNLMSLGAIDFGIIVDGAVIIIESVVFYTFVKVKKMDNAKLTQDELDDISNNSSTKMMNAAFFGQLIILIVFLPILTLQGVEGKMFAPMAMTFSFAVIGAMILCLTYVPMMASLVMSKSPSTKEGWGDKFINWLSRIYEPVLLAALKRKTIILSVSVVLLITTILTFNKMGGEFVPALDEGDLAMHAILKPGSSLEETEKVCQQIETTILTNFPEVTSVVSKIGVAEIPTDPMPMDLADMFLIIKPKSEWKTFETKEELIEKLKIKLAYLPGVNYEFSQPLEMRFNELMTGVRQDVAVKLFGEDLDVLETYASKMAKIISTVEGVADLKQEATKGLPQMTVKYNRKKIAQYGLNIRDLNTIIRTAFSGETAGVIFEGKKRFDLVVRLKDKHKKSIKDVKNIFVPLPDGNQIPLSEVATINYQSGPMQISREGTNLRTYVGINVRGRDVESVVKEIQEKLDNQLDLPPGYYIKYGGAFENLKRATSRLTLVVPIALVLIFLLLYLALKSFSQTIMIYMAIPLSAIGGVFGLWLRDMPFSISAGVGFIVLFGVAVLNGLVLITSMNQLKKEGLGLQERIIQGTKERIRPIFLTASTDILGFLPMAISTSAGAEVQRPLATVVIGGMLTASLLTLFVIPILYSLVESKSEKKSKSMSGLKLANILWIPIISGSLLFGQQSFAQTNTVPLTLEQAIDYGLQENGNIKVINLEIEKLKTLKRSSFNIDKTDIGVQYGQMNSFNNDLSFSIQQNFKFPTVYIKQRSLNEAYVEIGENQKIITENDLIKEIKSTWFQIIYLNQQSQLLIYQDSLHSELLRATQLKYESGDGTYLDQVTAETKLINIRVFEVENESNLKIYYKILQTLINKSDLNVIIAKDASIKKEFTLDLDSSVIATNPNLLYLQNQLKIEENKTAVAKAQILPDFSIGYINQSMIGNHTVNGSIDYYEANQRFQAVQASLSIPIFVRANRANISAQKIDQQIATTRAEYYQTFLLGEFERVIQDYLKYKAMLDYYEKSALNQANLILDNADKSYLIGNINYLEYVQSISIGIEIKQNYNTILNAYNQSIIAIEYLVGKR
jgi:cobalt-zinc-cadmium resistance protein CzcA